MFLGYEVLTEKGLQRTALASFHTLSVSLRNTYALRGVGRNMSCSEKDKKKKIKCKSCVFSSAAKTYHKWNCYPADAPLNEGDLSSFVFKKSINAAFSLIHLKPNPLFIFLFSSMGKSLTWKSLFFFFYREHKTWRLHAAFLVSGKQPSSGICCITEVTPWKLTITS